MTRHIVQYSGGIGSWATASRVIDEYGVGGVVLLFADVAGETCVCTHKYNQHINGRGPCGVKPDGEHYCGCTRWTRTPHTGEDEDSYRFIAE